MCLLSDPQAVLFISLTPHDIFLGDMASVFEFFAKLFNQIKVKNHKKRLVVINVHPECQTITEPYVCFIDSMSL